MGENEIVPVQFAGKWMGIFVTNRTPACLSNMAYENPRLDPFEIKEKREEVTLAHRKWFLKDLGGLVWVKSEAPAVGIIFASLEKFLEGEGRAHRKVKA